MSDAELKALIDQRVAEGVQDALLSMGVDTSTAENIRKWQKRMAFLEGLEEASRTLWGHVRVVIAGAIALGLTYIVWDKVGGKP